MCVFRENNIYTTKFISVGTTCKYVINRLNLLLFLIPAHAQQLVIIQLMDSCIPKEEEANFQTGRPFLFTKFKMNAQQVPQCKQSF